MSREKIVEESLGPEDKTQKSYEGKLDGVYGIMFMSKRKLIFVTEKGLFRKSYNLVLDLPYEKIKSLRTEGKNSLIIETEDLKHTFESTLRISTVEEALRELMEQDPSHVI
ncbi:PH domain-containing protein [Candidatus Bathyarchaeota archaeon]|nr:PH domain-containing protein [Candidatus Bathyarchaeota archaeon]